MPATGDAVNVAVTDAALRELSQQIEACLDAVTLEDLCQRALESGLPRATPSGFTTPKSQACRLTGLAPSRSTALRGPSSANTSTSAGLRASGAPGVAMRPPSSRLGRRPPPRRKAKP